MDVKIKSSQHHHHLYSGTLRFTISLRKSTTRQKSSSSPLSISILYPTHLIHSHYYNLHLERRTSRQTCQNLFSIARSTQFVTHQISQSELLYFAQSISITSQLPLGTLLYDQLSRPLYSHIKSSLQKYIEFIILH